MDQCSICSDVSAVLLCLGEEREEPKGEVVNLLVETLSYTHQWPQAVGSYKNKVVHKSGGNELSPWIRVAQLRDEISSLIIRKGLRVELLLLCIKKRKL